MVARISSKLPDVLFHGLVELFPHAHVGVKELNDDILLCLELSTDYLHTESFWFHFTAEEMLIVKGGGACCQPVHMWTLGERMNVCQTPAVISPQAASLPMSVIIVGVGPAEFDGKSGYLHSVSS